MTTKLSMKEAITLQSNIVAKNVTLVYPEKN